MSWGHMVGYQKSPTENKIHGIECLIQFSSFASITHHIVLAAAPPPTPANPPKYPRITRRAGSTSYHPEVASLFAIAL